VLSQALERVSIVASSQSKDAQIAVFKCSTRQYNSLYFDLASNSWILVPERIVNGMQLTKNCIESDKDLFSLCRKMYPNLGVQNIEKVQQTVEFSAYKDTREIIFEKQSIQPYKCLHGKYESKSLFVPTDCQFKSLYANNDECKPQDDWQQQAAKACQVMNMALNASEFLQWCDQTKLAHFNGIEFVCCSNIDLNAIIEDEDIDDDGDEDEFNDENEGIPSAEIDAKNEDFVSVNGDRDEIERKNAKISDIDAKYESKQIDLNKKWKAEIKTSSEPDKSLIDSDYKKQLSDLENAKQAEIYETEVAFNEILQAKLNKDKYEKTKELDKMQYEITSGKSTDNQKLQKLFTDLFTLYERDRLLQVSIYKRLKSNFPDQYKLQVKSIVENLKLIDAIVIKNKKLIAKFKFDSNFATILDKTVFLRYKQSQEDAIKIIKESDSIASESVVSVIADEINKQQDLDDDYDSNEVVYDQISTVASVKTTTIKAVQIKNDDYSDDDDDDDDNDVNSEIDIGSESNDDNDDDLNEIKVIDDQNKVISSNINTDPNFKSNNLNKVLNDGGDNDEDDDDDDNDDDDDDYEIPKYNQVKAKGFSKVALIVTICAFCSLIVIIVLGLMIKRKNSNRFGKKNGFVQVGQFSPEEAHVNQMQINGYENPAYKYFEQNQA
jgi:hypothetical protein